MKKRWTVALWMALTAASLEGQHEFGTWIGVSAGTPTLIGTTERVSLVLTAVRYSQVIFQRPTYSLRYTVDLLPFARMTASSTTVQGKGVAPIGFEMRFRPDKRLQPSWALHGGFIYFNHDIPQPGGARFNFTADLGAGLHINIGRSIDLDTGYKYHHLSNGYRAPTNPGFDSSVLFAGVQLRK